jgi:hypothetical protein
MQSAEISRFFEMFPPEERRQLEEIKEEVLQLEDEDLADLADLLDLAMDDLEVRAELEAELEIELTDEVVFILNAIVKDVLPQTEGVLERAKFAQGGIASLGRNGDTMLAHITPGEAALLRARGGSGTINPATGLPEYFLGKVFKGVKNAVKKVGSFLKKNAPTILGIVGAATGNPWLAALGSGIGTKIAGGSWKDAFTSAAIAGVTTGAFKGVQAAWANRAAEGASFGKDFLTGFKGSFTAPLSGAAGATNAAADSAISEIDVSKLPNRIGAPPAAPAAPAVPAAGATPAGATPAGAPPAAAPGKLSQVWNKYLSPNRIGLPEGAGLLRRYAPLAAVSGGITALTGGFSEEPVAPPLYNPEDANWWPERRRELDALYGSNWSTPGFMQQPVTTYSATPTQTPIQSPSMAAAPMYAPPPLQFQMPEEDQYARDLLYSALQNRTA